MNRRRSRAMRGRELGRRNETGSAVILAVVLLGLLVGAAVLGSAVVALVAAHRQAQAAADLAALTAARSRQAGGQGCDRAAEIAEAGRSELVRCRVDRADAVEVEVRIRLPPILGSGSVRARSRAGPAGFSR